MGNPSLGTLEVSDGLVLEHCNPSFLWSDCSRYLAVLQVPRTGMFFAAHMVIVDTQMQPIEDSVRQIIEHVESSFRLR